jgi:hypothetical protein
LSFCAWIWAGSRADRADSSSNASLTDRPLKKPKVENEASADLSGVTPD